MFQRRLLLRMYILSNESRGRATRKAAGRIVKGKLKGLTKLRLDLARVEKKQEKEKWRRDGVGMEEGMENEMRLGYALDHNLLELIGFDVFADSSDGFIHRPVVAWHARPRRR